MPLPLPGPDVGGAEDAAGNSVAADEAVDEDTIARGG